MTNGFLPICRQDMTECHIEQMDFVYVIGDAYVDHPSFGHAIISRILDAHGYKVGIISQPDWKNEESIAIYGRPRLGFLISGGDYDYERAAVVILDEFRGGKLGKVSFEEP